MNFLKPHLYLEKIHGSDDYNLSVLMYVDDNLKLKDIVGPTYDQIIKHGPNKGKKETVIELLFERSIGTTNPDPVDFNFIIDGKKTGDGKDIKIRVDTKHVPPHHNHDGTSSAHYGDPK
ncbi:MAG: hypothetical protein ACOYXT_19465 [Bacteroidota bacterium]